MPEDPKETVLYFVRTPISSSELPSIIRQLKKQELTVNAAYRILAGIPSRVVDSSMSSVDGIELVLDAGEIPTSQVYDRLQKVFRGLDATFYVGFDFAEKVGLPKNGIDTSFLGGYEESMYRERFAKR